MSLTALTRSTALEMAGFGSRVTALCPVGVGSPVTAEVSSKKQLRCDGCPSDSAMGAPQEIANSVVLCSEQASFMAEN